MAVDPNIILQAQTPQFASPLDTAIKGMTLKQLSQQGQIQDRQIADDQATRDAFKNNMTTDANGNPTLNRNAALGDLMKVNPAKAIDYQKMFQNQDLDQLKQQTDIAKQLSWSIQDEPSYQLARQKALQMGLPNADKIPPTYDPTFVQNWQMHTLEGGKQLDYQLAQQKLAQSQQDHQDNRDLRTTLAQSATDTRNDNKQNQAMQRTQTLLEQNRSNPATAQAEKDLYAAQKFDSLVNLYGDPNKLNPAQVQLAASEVAKIASGGVPSDHELAGLNPSTIPSGLAKAAEYFTNSPSSANAGEFVKRLQDYTSSLKSDAQGVIQDKYGRVIESNKKLVGDDNYQTLQDQYMGRFKNKSAAPAAAPAAPAADQFTPDVLSYAQAHGIAPEQAQAIKLQRGGQ